MGPTGDNLGDYRARAAACRAMAEKAAEFPSETRTWVQIAEMWEGLAARAEGQSPERAPEASSVEMTEADRSGDATDSAPLSEPAPASALPPAHEAAAATPARGPLRRAAVVAGFLLLPVLAVAAFWPGTDKPAITVAQRSAPAPLSSEPTAQPSKAAEPSAPVRVIAQAPAPAPAPAPMPDRVVADLPGAAPAPAPAAEPPAPPPAVAMTPPPAPAPVPTAQPPQERVAEAPKAPAAPATSEPLSETGSVGVRPEPAPEVAAPAPAPAPSPPQKVAALPKAQPLKARVSEPADEPAPARPKLTGTWWPSSCPKAKDRKNAVSMELAENRAKAGGASCTFLKKTQAGPAWTVVAKCSDGKASWTAHIRLVLEGKRLQWASERGTQTYQRCG
jgi:hypothetical protein